MRLSSSERSSTNSIQLFQDFDDIIPKSYYKDIILNVNSALSAYSQHSLSIDIKTSSGDIIELDFNNEKSLDYRSNEQEKSFSFSSKESFSFSYKGNGIDAQDRKEIDAFLKLAQPSIDNFVAGLNDGSSLTKPINKLTSNITSLLQPFKEKNDDTLHLTKDGLVKAMDRALAKEIEPLKQTEKIISHAQRFLEQMLKQLDKTEEKFYA